MNDGPGLAGRIRLVADDSRSARRAVEPQIRWMEQMWPSTTLRVGSLGVAVVIPSTVVPATHPQLGRRGPAFRSMGNPSKRPFGRETA